MNTAENKQQDTQSSQNSSQEKKLQSKQRKKKRNPNAEKGMSMNNLNEIKKIEKLFLP